MQAQWQQQQQQWELQQAAQQYQQLMMQNTAQPMQQLQPQKTAFGSNNPFASFGGGAGPSHPQQQQHNVPVGDLFSSEPTPQPQQAPPPQSPQQLSHPLEQPASPAGPPRVKTDNSSRFAELNRLLASGDGIDTFGNTGDMRSEYALQIKPFVSDCSRLTPLFLIPQWVMARGAVSYSSRQALLQWAKQPLEALVGLPRMETARPSRPSSLFSMSDQSLRGVHCISGPPAQLMTSPICFHLSMRYLFCTAT